MLQIFQRHALFLKQSGESSLKPVTNLQASLKSLLLVSKH